MKKLMFMLVLFVAVSLCFADWDTIQAPQPAKDIIDALVPLPANVAKEFGNTEKVRLIHHLIVLRTEIGKVLEDQGARIAELEKQVATLVKKPDVVSELPPE